MTTKVWPEGLDAVTNLMTQCHAFVRYLVLLIVPFRLNADHDLRVIGSPLDPTFILSLALLFALLATAIAVRRRTPSASFGVLWFLITLSFFLLIPLADLLVERRLYLPSIGFCLSATALIVAGVRTALGAAAGERPLRAARITWTIVLSAIVAINCWATVQRNAVWQDDVALWRDTGAGPLRGCRPGMQSDRRLEGPG
jgi:uncharacterized membrane protein